MLDSMLNDGDLSPRAKRVLATLGLLIVYRLGFTVPIPGMSPEFLTAQSNPGWLLGWMSVFSGGALGETTLFALALLPWITASLAQGLCLRFSPRVRRLCAGSTSDRRRIARSTRAAVLPIAVLEGLALYLGVFVRNPQMIEERMRGSLVLLGMVVVASLAAGAMLVLWLSEKIDEHGVGRGSLVICAAGLLARLPHTLLQVPYEQFWPMTLYMLALSTAALILLVVLWKELEPRSR